MLGCLCFGVGEAAAVVAIGGGLAAWKRRRNKKRGTCELRNVSKDEAVAGTDTAALDSKSSELES